VVTKVHRQVQNKVFGKAERLEATFRELDEQGSGRLSHQNFEKCLRKLGINVSKDDVHTLIAHHDEGQSGQIDYRTFTDKALPVEKQEMTVIKPHHQSDGTYYGNLSKLEAASTPHKVGDTFLKSAPSVEINRLKAKKTWSSPTKHMRNNWSIAPTGDEESEALLHDERLCRTRVGTAEEKRSRAQQSKQSWGEQSQSNSVPVAAVPSPAKGTSMTNKVLEKVNGKAKRLRAAFRMFDAGKAGTVTPHDFKQALWNLGVTVSDPEIARMVSRHVFHTTERFI